MVRCLAVSGPVVARVTPLFGSLRRARGLVALVGGALSALGCAPSHPSGPVFGGQGAIVDPGPRAAQVEARAPAGPCDGVPASTDAHFEDFEDGDNRLFGAFEREGYWYTATDHTPGGTVFPPDGKFETTALPEKEATPDNRVAAHFTAQGYKDWGAVWGVTLRHVGAAKCPLNAAPFSGLKFRVRGKGEIQVRFGMPETIATEYGGSCTEKCYDMHGTTLHLSDDWQVREVRFDRLQQGGWGKSVRFDPTRLLSLEFRAAPDKMPVEVWLDDFEWIPREASKG